VGAVDGFSPDWQEDDELVRRLRSLQWAPVPEELRQRCWEDFDRRVSEGALSQNGQVVSRPAFNVGERYDFRRFAPSRRTALAQAGSGRYTPRRAFSVS
jgi:hypothetical protein